MNPQLSTASYLGILIAFLLPFMDFSCQGHKIASLSGYQVAFGTTLDMKSPMDGSTKKQRIDGTPIVAVAFLLALVAAAIALRFGIAGSVCAGISLILLLLAQSSINKKALEEGQGIIAVNYDLGYYLTLLLLVGGAIIGVIASKKKA
ncbi:MAG: hypothetical protein M0Q93_12500 [Terrimicrobiaceae bacterium]|nr:hypothetical protein [Terrimicrobiaceae bacterium]